MSLSPKIGRAIPWLLWLKRPAPPRRSNTHELVAGYGDEDFNGDAALQWKAESTLASTPN